MNTGVKPMKRPLALLILALLMVSLLAAACGAQPYDPPTPIPTLPPATLPAEMPTEAPAAAATPVEETAGTAAPTEAAAGGEDALAAGSQVFEQNCAACHNLTAEAKVGPGLAGLFEIDQLPNGQPLNDENLREWIRNGGGAMPGIPLTAEQMDVLIPYLRDATQ